MVISKISQIIGIILCLGILNEESALGGEGLTTNVDLAECGELGTDLKASPPFSLFNFISFCQCWEGEISLFCLI